MGRTSGALAAPLRLRWPLLALSKPGRWHCGEARWLLLHADSFIPRLLGFDTCFWAPCFIQTAVLCQTGWVKSIAKSLCFLGNFPWLFLIKRKVEFTSVFPFPGISESHSGSLCLTLCNLLEWFCFHLVSNLLSFFIKEAIRRVSCKMPWELPHRPECFLWSVGSGAQAHLHGQTGYHALTEPQ